jgi:hypothetical protein
MFWKWKRWRYNYLINLKKQWQLNQNCRRPKRNGKIQTQFLIILDFMWMMSFWWLISSKKIIYKSTKIKMLISHGTRMVCKRAIKLILLFKNIKLLQKMTKSNDILKERFIWRKKFLKWLTVRLLSKNINARHLQIINLLFKINNYFKKLKIKNKLMKISPKI